MPACGMARIECGRSSGSRRPSTMARHALHTHREEAEDFREGVLGQRHARRISFHPVPTRPGPEILGAQGETKKGPSIQI